MKKCYTKIVSVILSVLMVLSVLPSGTVSVSAADESLAISKAGGTSYSLFNSGNTTDSGYSAAHPNRINPAPNTHDNNGYDLYGRISSGSRFRLGLSFAVNLDIDEYAILNVKAWDVDEAANACGYGYEYDYIYLVDETTGTEVKLDTHLSGQNDTWNTSAINVAPELFTEGHTYHFELQMTCTGNHFCNYYCVTVRAVDLIVNGSEPIIPSEKGIKSADLSSASISLSGLVSVDLTANAYSEEAFTLEYKAVCSSNGAQYGGKEYSVTIPTASTVFSTTFQLESAAPRGTYEITVFIKDGAGNVLTTRTAVASYGYSAVSYNANGGSQNLPTDGSTYSSGDTVTVLFNYIPSKYGYTFLGWSTDPSATEPTYTEAGNKTFVIGTEDVVLYAVWKKATCTHNWQETSRTDATCTSEGTIVYTCSECGKTKKETIAALGHNYAGGTCTRCGVAEPTADVWDGSIATGFGGGTGTEADPYLIYTGAQLAYLAQTCNAGNTYADKFFMLMNNIDLNCIEWTPIGVGSTAEGKDSTTLAFSGTFNGNGRYISGLNVNITSLKRAGLFGALNSATVTMLGIRDANITITQQYIISGGVIAGTANNSTITKCDVSGNVSVTDTAVGKSRWASAGMIVGYTAGSVMINSCVANGSVSGTMPNDWNAYVGGIVGSVDYYGGTCTISNTYFCGQVNAYGYDEGYAGGIVGAKFRSASISNCFVVADIASSDYADAISPEVNGARPTTSNSYYSSSTSSTLATSTSLSNFQSQSWIETNLGWDFDTIWEFRAGSDYPVLQGFDQGGGVVPPHTHDYQETSRTDATCTESGLVVYTCSCGDTRTDVLPALHHDLVTIIEQEVSCTQDGVIVDRCQRPGCSYEKRTVVHGEHTYHIEETKEPTCTENGYILYVCSKCHDSYREELIACHNYEESDRVEPAVGIAGKLTYTCTKCGDSYDVELPALTPVEKNSSVLLIQDSLPWANDVNTQLLELLLQNGTISSYNIIRTSALNTFDLSQYGVIMIANDQTTAMYDRLEANAEKLENYVRAGGVLIYGACDEGWGGCGSFTSDLPGGVKTSNYYSVHNYIVDPLHPIVTGVNTDNRSLQDKLLKGNYCSHTYFLKSSLPADTDIILMDANGNPTLVEYKLGDGTVIASGLTWEYFYVRTHYNMLTNYSKYAFDDMITYAVKLSGLGGCAHNFAEGVVHAPTCTENGYTSYTCTLCGTEYRDNILPATGHAWDAGVVIKQPTRTESGIKQHHCANCSETKDVEIQPYSTDIQIGTVTARPGETVVVPVTLINAPAIKSMSVSNIQYDTSKMTLTKVEWACNAEIRNWDASTGRGVMTFSENTDANGEVMYLTFVVNDFVEDSTVSINGAFDVFKMDNGGDEIPVGVFIIEGGVEIYNQIRGDMDGNDKLNSNDAIYLLYHIMFGDSDYPIRQNADVNGDGKVNSNDAVYLLYHIMFGATDYPLY